MRALIFILLSVYSACGVITTCQVPDRVCPYEGARETPYRTCSDPSAADCPVCVKRANQTVICRKLTSGCNANTWIVDDGIALNNTRVTGLCPQPSGGNNDPCASVRCAEGRCVVLNGNAVCTSICEGQCEQQNCAPAVENGQVVAKCSPCPTAICTQPPAGCKDVIDPRLRCPGCGTRRCACTGNCGPLSFCNATQPTSNLARVAITIPTGCVCSPGSTRPFCPDGSSPNTVCTCNDAGTDWTCPTFVQDPCTRTCQYPRCPAPVGCTAVRNNVAIEPNTCPSCARHFRIACPPDACDNCALPGLFCREPANFNMSGTDSLTTTAPVCRCVPGNTRDFGCRRFTCKSDGTGFESSVIDASRCCNPATFTPKVGLCGNICACTPEGIVRCTARPCVCREGAVRFDRCRKFVCRNNLWVRTTNDFCQVDRCYNNGTAVNMDASISSPDGCFRRRCAQITVGDVSITRLVSEATPDTCNVTAAFAIRCYRIVFPDRESFSEAEFLLRPIVRDRRSSITVDIVDGTVTVNVCIKYPIATTTRQVTNDCDTIGLGSVACDVTTDKSSTTTAGAAALSASMLLVIIALLGFVVA